MIEVGRMLDEVAREVGVADYGSPTAIEGLNTLVASAARDASLNAAGWATLEATCRRSLANRLRVVDWHRRNPGADNTAVSGAIFIVGASRTGTTALSHLLAADPDCRAPRHWEVTSSLPPPRAETYWDDPRYRAHRAESAYIPEAFRAIHYDPPEASIECTQILAQHFASLQYPCLYNVPAYDEWLMSCDMEPAYRYHRLVLQLLQSEYPGRWMLKAPDHAIHLESLYRIYPDARFVMTHRDPVKAVASACSLARSLTGHFSDENHDTYIADHWPELVATMFDRIVDFRERHPHARFVDIPYADIVADPLQVARRVYASFDIAFTPTAEAAMRDHAEREKQHRYGRHFYAPEDFGLDRSTVEKRLARYLERFDMPAEPD